MKNDANLRVLAIDPATKTGWAHSCGISGVQDFSLKRDESSGIRLLKFRNMLKSIHETEGIDLVAFEAARHAGPGMQGALTFQAEMQGVLKEWCQSEGIEFRGYSPSTIKKHATGKGNAGKKEVMDAAKGKWSAIRILDNNHSDALWLLDLVMHELN